jgi:hypothetical protein
MKNIHKIGKELFITSDEEIKEGDWYFDGTDLVHKKTKYNDALVDGNKNAKKIILTTDFRLAPDVQKIDDEFLEWFVKNPSCEEVKVENVYKTASINFGNQFNYYKIIIPKQEPDYTALLQPVGTIQETLEEETLSKIKFVLLANNDAQAIRLLEQYAEFQKERSYSEKEVLQLLQKALTHQDDGEIGSLVTAQGEIRTANFYSWFERFKKK